jgi:hypothetical protein
MLAPGNLPTLAAGVNCEYVIHTTADDAMHIRQSAAFQRLRALLPVSLQLFKPGKTRNPITLHHQIWRQASDHARRHRALILLMAPDVAWADGSFGRLRAAIEAGKRAIFMAYPRVVSETILPAIAKGFPPSVDQSVTIPPPDLLTLALTHIHPLMAAYSRSSDNFPRTHPEMILWPIAGGGFMLRLLARELFCFEPGRYKLNSQSLLACHPASEEIEVLRDSREFLGVSFSPLWKDTGWYLRRAQLDPLFTGRWWIHYDSPINDTISAFDLHFTCGKADEQHWRRAKQQADNLLIHLRSAREFTRILERLRQMGHWHTASFLAWTLTIHGLARRWPHRGRFVVLAPTDKAIERAGLVHVLRDTNAAEARRIIEAHVAIYLGPDPIRDGLELITLAGRRLVLKNSNRAQYCGINVVIPTSRVLLEARRPPRAVSKAIPTPGSR